MILCVLPGPGAQLYVPPVRDGVAVSVAFVPKHTVSFATDTVGGASTVTVPVPVPDPHAPYVYVTVYVALVAGVTVMDCVVAPPGAQLYVPPAIDGVAESVALLV